MSHRDPEFVKVPFCQLWEIAEIDLVVPERLLIAFPIKAPEPFTKIHPSHL